MLTLPEFLARHIIDKRDFDTKEYIDILKHYGKLLAGGIVKHKEYIKTLNFRRCRDCIHRYADCKKYNVTSASECEDYKLKTIFCPRDLGCKDCHLFRDGDCQGLNILKTTLKWDSENKQPLT